MSARDFLVRGVVVLSAAAVLPLTACSGAEPPPVNRETVVTEQTLPALQQVTTVFSGRASVHRWVFDQAAVDALADLAYDKSLNGEIGYSVADRLAWQADQLSSHPARYFGHDTTTDRWSGQVAMGGSAFAVAADGTFATAAHLVKPDGRVRQALQAQAEQQFAKALVGRVLLNTNFSAADSARIMKAVRALMAADIQVSVDGAPQVTVEQAVGSPSGRTVKKLRAEVVALSSDAVAEDVAVLHVEGQTAVPAVPLGDSNAVQTGDHVTLVSFPADATFLKGLDADSQLEPTASEGTITAIKHNQAGLALLQTSAAASPGSSGGALVDSAGRVVGILVSSAQDGSGHDVEGAHFAMPVSALREKLRHNNLAAAPGLTTEVYDQALDAHWRGWEAQALPLFQRVKGLYPAHPYVDQYIQRAQTAIASGTDRTPQPLPILLLAGVGGGLLLLLTLGVLGVRAFRRRSQARQAGLPPVAPAGPESSFFPAFPTQAQWEAESEAAPPWLDAPAGDEGWQPIGFIGAAEPRP